LAPNCPANDGRPVRLYSDAMPEAGTMASFGPGLFSFFTELRVNNDREWFSDN